MGTWIANSWRAAASGFWLVPGGLMLLGLALAVLLPEVDRRVSGITPRGLQTTAVTARATLTSLCGAMVTVTGLVASTTMVALSITAGQLGPRLLRSFLRQMVTQVTLGFCLGTSIFCLILLRRVGSLDGEAFVPHLSLLVATAAAVGSLAMIVYFIHRVAYSMQAQNVASDVADDLDNAVDRLFPATVGDVPTAEPDEDEEPIDDQWREMWDRFDSEPPDAVPADQDGYLQAIDGHALLRLAQRRDVVLRLRARPGDYVRRDEIVCEALPAGRFAEGDHRRVRRSLYTGASRTPQQDVACAIHELVEIALRALSPGVNDPFTAITCIDRLSSALRRVVQRDLPSGLRVDEQGEPRLIVQPRTHASIIATGFDQLRQNARGNVAVVARLLEALEAIAARASTRSARIALARQADLLVESARDGGLTGPDLADIEERYQRLRDTVTPRRPSLLRSTDGDSAAATA